MFVCDAGHRLFYDASPAAGLLLVNPKNQVLLVQRAADPGKGLLGMPGGFCDAGETLEQALQREIQEEIGLRPHDYTPPQYLTSAPEDYPFDGETRPVFGVAFWARINGNPQIVVGDDAADFVWLPLDDFPWDRLAFPTHGTFVACLQRQVMADEPRYPRLLEK